MKREKFEYTVTPDEAALGPASIILASSADIAAERWAELRGHDVDEPVTVTVTREGIPAHRFEVIATVTWDAILLS